MLGTALERRREGIVRAGAWVCAGERGDREDPGAGLLDGQDVVAGDLVFDLDGELFTLRDAVQRREPLMNRGEMHVQLIQLFLGHQQLPGRSLVGERDNGVGAIVVRQDFLRRRVRVGIGDQVLADLTVEVVAVLPAVGGVNADGDAVDQLVLVVGMHQHAHGRGQVVDAVELPFREGAEVPQAGVGLLQGLVDPVFHGLAGLLGLGVVEAGAVEARQVLVVGAGPVAQRLPLRVRRVHRGQRVDDPLGRVGAPDLLA